jgi:hypothetical protein
MADASAQIFHTAHLAVRLAARVLSQCVIDTPRKRAG